MKPQNTIIMNSIFPEGRKKSNRKVTEAELAFSKARHDTDEHRAIVEDRDLVEIQTREVWDEK